MKGKDFQISNVTTFKYFKGTCLYRVNFNIFTAYKFYVNNE